MRFVYLLILAFVTLECNAQICNFCNYENVKDLLTKEGMPYTERLERNGEMTLRSTSKNFIKTWHFKYDKCFLYEIEVLRESYYKALVVALDKEFARMKDSTWESNENRVESVKTKNIRKFSFYSKPSVLNGVMIN